MPRSVRWKGYTVVRPGMYYYANFDGLVNLDLGSDAAILLVGEADSGEPQTSAATPVVHTFTDAQDMIDYFISGHLAEAARFAFDPCLDGQQSEGVPVRGCDVVYVIKTNNSTQASFDVKDTLANTALTLKSRTWGTFGNDTWFKITVTGTGIYLDLGRYVAPNIGSEVSTNFSITTTDEWLDVRYTGADAAKTMTFNGTTLALAGGVGADDLTVTCTGKTVNQVAQELNGSGKNYLAQVSRSDRTNILSTYMDRCTTVNVKVGAPAWGSTMGVSYDIVEWVNANSVYCEATWVAGWEPKVYTQTNLAGGTLGTTDTSRHQAALKVAKKLSTRFIVSAYPANCPGGGVTLADMQQNFLTHLNSRNPVTGRSECQGFACADNTTKADLWSALALINNKYCSITNDEVKREDESGTVEWLGSHCVATAAAAIMAGSPIATPLTQKIIKGYDLRNKATDFDPDETTDFALAINNGLLFLESVPGVGIRFAKGISTYKTEDNDAHILLETIEAELWHSRVLRRRIEQPKVGSKGSGTRSARAILGIVRDVHRELSDTNSPDFILIEGTDSQGNVVPPYRNMRVVLSGDQVYISGEVTYVTGINFIFSDWRASLPSAVAS